MQQQQSNDNNNNKNNSKNICEIVPIWEMLWEICACIDEKQVYGANERRKWNNDDNDADADAECGWAAQWKSLLVLTTQGNKKKMYD